MTKEYVSLYLAGLETKVNDENLEQLYETEVSITIAGMSIIIPFVNELFRALSNYEEEEYGTVS